MAFINEQFTTADVPAEQGAAHWRDFVRSIHYNFDFDTSVPNHYTGALRRYVTEDYQVITFDEAEAEFRREPRHISKDGVSVYEVFAITDGETRIEQFGTTTRCVPGSLILLDAAAPFLIRQSGRMSGLIFQTSRSALERCIPETDLVCGRLLDGSAGLPRMTFDFLRSIGRESEFMQPGQFEESCNHLLEMLALLLDGADDARLSNSRARAVTLKRLKEYIRDNVDDPTLRTAQVAAQFQLSERYVQLLFHEAGTTVRDYIRLQRLANARQRLGSPLHRHKTITEIAYECGFSSSALFSTAFKAQYQQSPRDYRLAGLYGRQT